MSNHYIDGNGNVVYSDDKIFRIVGMSEKTETNRIDIETVEDVSYTFNLELGEYVEQSRETRSEPLPTPPPTDADKIAQLEAENAQLRERDSQMQEDTSFILEALINAGLI